MIGIFSNFNLHSWDWIIGEELSKQSTNIASMGNTLCTKIPSIRSWCFIKENARINHVPYINICLD